jgi:hypothetical protein
MPFYKQLSHVIHNRCLDTQRFGKWHGSSVEYTRFTSTSTVRRINDTHFELYYYSQHIADIRLDKAHDPSYCMYTVVHSVHAGHTNLHEEFLGHLSLSRKNHTMWWSRVCNTRFVRHPFTGSCPPPGGDTRLMDLRCMDGATEAPWRTGEGQYHNYYFTPRDAVVRHIPSKRTTVFLHRPYGSFTFLGDETRRNYIARTLDTGGRCHCEGRMREPKDIYHDILSGGMSCGCVLKEATEIVHPAWREEILRTDGKPKLPCRTLAKHVVNQYLKTKLS